MFASRRGAPDRAKFSHAIACARYGRAMVRLLLGAMVALLLGVVPAPAARAQQNLTPPSIPPHAREGDTVTCDPGTWSPTPAGLKFGWFVAQAGSNVLQVIPHHASTYTIPTGEAGSRFLCEVRAAEDDSFGTGAISNQLLAIGPAPVNQARPAVTPGTATAGETLSCTPGRWSGNATVTHTWLRDGTPMEGQTALTYVTTAADAGRAIACRSTATDAVGGVSADSDAVTPAAAPVVEPPTPYALPRPATTIVPIRRIALLPSARRCAGPRTLRLRLRALSAGSSARAEVFVAGRRVRTLTGDRLRTRIVLRRLPKRRWTLKIVITLASGDRLQATRRYRTCAPIKKA
jgi:hypothetical protein